MKVILYMASTMNGIIARSDDDRSFVSKVNWEGFSAIAQRTGNLVVGRRTYELMVKEGDLERLPDVKVVVVTNNQDYVPSHPAHKIVHLPQEAILTLEGEGMQEVLVAGGGGMNASFMEQNLLDEIYVDIEPWIIGKGIPLFAPGYFEAPLILKDLKRSDNTAQLHYEVKK
jgi:dihydrofolate reductase